MSREEHAHLLDALTVIDPATLDYQGWVDVGMALHESGYTWQDWDAWSRRDPRRFHEGECERKWAGFGNGDDRVTSGTIIHMAEMRGWTQPGSGMGQALDWGDSGTVTAGPDALGADAQPIEDADEGDWNPCGMLSDYLGALFDDDDIVGYVVNCWERDGRKMPKQGDWSRTAGELRQALAKPTATMDKVIGAWDETAGAWIRFNPLDGHGCGNDNVTDYRYALVESDVLDLDKQFPAIKDMRLPCAAVVSSGGKSVHAIVKVDAPNKDEYAKRVKWLYAYCDRHGFVTDKQNKNASRLSRMPGATRNGRRQLLLATNIGEPDWESWKRWAEESEDDLPDDACDDWDEPINLKPMLIGLTERDCILRQGAKMIVVGDSKMGKSYTLIDLGEAICVGGEWLGMQCAQGKVFYVNLEIDPVEFRWRQHKVWDERPESGEDEAERLIRQNFHRWDLRGYAANLRELAPKLVRRVLRHGPPGTFAAIIIDPIYKVNGGDDNDAKAVAEFTNTIDLIIQACGCSVIYAHHHPKGATGGRKTIDRMSGSGVYGRDADTVIDFGELFVPEEIWSIYEHNPCYRAEVKCRSFGYRKPIDAIFMWPRFIVDGNVQDGDGNNIPAKLSGCKILGEDPKHEGQVKGGETTKTATELMWDKKLMALNDAFDNDPHNISPDTVELTEEFVKSIEWGRFGIPKSNQANLATIKGWVDGKSDLIGAHFEFADKSKKILRRKAEPDDE